MIIYLLGIFSIHLALSLLLTPLVIKFARFVGAVDIPNPRNIHKKKMPLLGGVAIFMSFILAFGMVQLLFPDLIALEIPDSFSLFFIALALISILMLGIWDDISPQKPGIKFLLQLLIATMVYAAGFGITELMNPFTNEIIQIGYFSYPLTVLWIVGVTNAFNLIDGLDGLASGVAIISSFSIFTLSIINQDINTAILVLMLAGSLFGFLFYNFYPAKIFLGDSGSLILGFSMAIFSMQSFSKLTTAFAMIVPVLVLGLPIIDTLVSMLRRFLKTYLPQNEVTKHSTSLYEKLHTIFLPDRSHIHHQLIQRGLSHRNTVLVLYFVSAVLGGGAIALTNLGPSENTHLILLLTSIAIFYGIKKLKYREMALLQNGIFLHLYEHIILQQEYKHILLDTLFIILSYTCAFQLIEWVDSGLLIQDQFIASLLLVTFSQLFIFWGTGIYKETIRIAGIGNMIKLLKGILFAVIVASFVLSYIATPWQKFNLLLPLLDFYFLGTLVLGMRILFHILNYLFKRNRYQNVRHNILIYGADEKGILALHNILNNGINNWNPLGFLDDNPRLEGKYINGYPIYGGHWKLQRLLNTNNIQEILIASDNIKPEIMRRIQQVANEKGITLLKFQINFNTFNGKCNWNSRSEVNTEYGYKIDVL